MHKVSVITINLNNAEGLKRTMKSVNEQTFPDFEYIIIDGGSTDGSIDIIREFQKHTSGTDLSSKFNLYWESEPDRGIYNAMNKGIVRSQGEYCFFLNSGDYFASPKVLENVMKMKATEDILFGNLLIYVNDKLTEKSFGKPKLSFLDLYLSSMKHQASFIKRILFDKFGLYDESLKIIADWEFFLKAVGLGNASYRHISEDIACFDNAGISNNSYELIISERKRVLETHIPSMILDDYKFFERFAFLRPAYNYTFTILLIRIIAKCAKVYGKIHSH